MKEEKKIQSEELQNRREFFKKAAKGVLPVLGAIALMNMPLLTQAKESNPIGSCTNCSYACGGSCSRGCSNGCSRSCKTSCAINCGGQTSANPCGSCSNACYSSCTGGCRSSCNGSCISSCYGNLR